MSYLKFLNLLEAVKGLPTFPAMDAVEERLLNTFAVLWQVGAPVTVLQSMEMLQDASPATVHRRLKTLRSKGFIALELDPSDNRVKYVIPTALTKEYFAKVEDCLEKAQQ
jgi:DNA-binding MarR family transcriptional regulator